MLARKTGSKFPSLVDRFVAYAKVHTTSSESSDTYPSTARQFDLARILVAELQAIGLKDAAVDEHCYVTATLPASTGCEKVPVIAFISHMDTYPEVSGENVVPTFHENYKGGDIELPKNGKKIIAAENPYLQAVHRRDHHHRRRHHPARRRRQGGHRRDRGGPDPHPRESGLRRTAR